jgi:hypothetical protein
VLTTPAAQARNENTYEIIRSLRLGDPSLDLTTQFHHCFWCACLSPGVPV